MSKTNPFIALVTDFGTADAYVGIMKGVISSINPAISVIDISHEVIPGKIDQAGYLLWSSYKYFPTGTIFVCVVDPGVGSPRKILCVQTSKYIFLAPDNGALKFILSDTEMKDVYDVSKPEIFKHPVSSTFHGRDIFAPLAAHLACGEKPSSFGSLTRVRTPVEGFVQVHQKRKTCYEGRVIHIDRFGNIITNLMLPEKRLPNFLCKIGKKTITTQVRYYAEIESDNVCIVRGSSHLLEISKREDNAAKYLHSRPGQLLTLELI